MARGFGTVLGSASTDRIVTTVTATNVATSYSLWLNRGSGAGGAAAGRLWDKDGELGIYWWTNNNRIHFFRTWSSAVGEWNIALPSTGVWHHLLVTYNGGSVDNDPIFYLDGSAVAATENGTPSGTIVTNSNPLYLGNAYYSGAYSRVFDGSLAEFAIWNSILTAANARSLIDGVLPTAIESPVCYFPIPGDSNPEPDSSGNGYTGTVTGTLKTTHPTFPTPLTPSLTESLIYG